MLPRGLLWWALSVVHAHKFCSAYAQRRPHQNIIFPFNLDLVFLQKAWYVRKANIQMVNPDWGWGDRAAFCWGRCQVDTVQNLHVYWIHQEMLCGSTPRGRASRDNSWKLLIHPASSWDYQSVQMFSIWLSANGIQHPSDEAKIRHRKLIWILKETVL